MTELEVLVYMVPKILIATLCGFLIGLERENHNKNAGLRTYIIVCVGAALFTASGFVLNTDIKVDPTRIIGQIITGIGFLGGGIIFKHDEKVNGVTSAAFIWLTSAIGVFIGLGYLFSSVLFTVGLLIMLIILLKVENSFKN